MSQPTYHHDINVEKKNQYSQLLNDIADATRDGDQRRVRRLKSRLNRVAEEVIELNSGLAVSIARKVFPFGDANSIDADDYVQTAKMGLWQAFTSWDPSKGTLATYSRQFIKGGVGRSVQSTEMPQISYGDYTARPGVLAAQKKLRTTLGREPTHEEIAAASGQFVALVARVLAPIPSRLDEQLGDTSHSDKRRGDYLAAADDTEAAALGPDVDELIADGDPATLARYLDGLEPASLWVFVRRYGLDGAPAQRLNLVAWDIGFGRQKTHRLAQTGRDVLSDRAG